MSDAGRIKRLTTELTGGRLSAKTALKSIAQRNPLKTVKCPTAARPVERFVMKAALVKNTDRNVRFLKADSLKTGQRSYDGTVNE